MEQPSYKSNKSRYFFNFIIIAYKLFALIEQIFTANAEFNGYSSEIYRKYLNVLFITKIFQGL